MSGTTIMLLFITIVIIVGGITGAFFELRAVQHHDIKSFVGKFNRYYPYLRRINYRSLKSLWLLFVTRTVLLYAVATLKWSHFSIIIFGYFIINFIYGWIRWYQILKDPHKLAQANRVAHQKHLRDRELALMVKFHLPQFAASKMLDRIN